MSHPTEDDSEVNLNKLKLPKDHPLNNHPWNRDGNQFTIDFTIEDEPYLVVVERIEDGDGFDSPYCHVGLYKKTGDGRNDFDKLASGNATSNSELQTVLRDIGEHANKYVIPGEKP